ncbi:MAG: Gfo/Idh/MocA family protein [Rhodoglobus sp.]
MVTTRTGGIEVLVVGTGFGRGFLAPYLSHPLVSAVGLCDISTAQLRAVAAEHGIEATYSTLDDALASGRWDAVHIATPVHLHVPQTLAVLASGRACASAVPMATSLDDIDRVIDAVGDRTYMMMETALYGREYLHAIALRDSGELGPIGYLSGAHMQDLDGFAPYWMGYAPMQYATHIVAPLLGLAGARAQSVTCLGSGMLRDSHRGDGTNPFPVESALFQLATPSPLAAQVTMSFFENARGYTEGFSVYADRIALEWPSIEGDPSVVHRAPVSDGVHRGRPIVRSLELSLDRADLLPASLRAFTRPSIWDPGPGLPSIEVDASHGGSHPHLAHEFVSAVALGRRSPIDHVTAATITAPGIVAHQSALQGGRMLEIPEYS